MADYTVTLDGKELSLRYTLDDRAAVEDLFPDKDGLPGSLPDLVHRCVNAKGGGPIKLQIALLWGGLRHLGNDWTIITTAKAVKDFIASGGEMVGITKAVYRTILRDGALGKIYEEPAPEGKEAAPTA